MKKEEFRVKDILIDCGREEVKTTVTERFFIFTSLFVCAASLSPEASAVFTSLFVFAGSGADKVSGKEERKNSRVLDSFTSAVKVKRSVSSVKAQFLKYESFKRKKSSEKVSVKYSFSKTVKSSAEKGS